MRTYNKITTLLVLLPVLCNAQQLCTPDSIPATTPISQFVDHKDGTVTDKKTGLMWKRCGEGQTWRSGICIGSSKLYNWQGALRHAQTVNASGGFVKKTDWRVPNIKELHSIIERQCVGPALNRAVFSDNPVNSYWSSSMYANIGNEAWFINFDLWFLVASMEKNKYLKLRLVRGG